MDTITKKKAQRFLFLKHLYDATGGAETRIVSGDHIGKDLGFDETTTLGIAFYLKGQGLIGMPARDAVYITAHGIHEIERTLTHPDEPTEHFPPASLIRLNPEGDITVDGESIGRDNTMAD